MAVNPFASDTRIGGPVVEPRVATALIALAALLLASCAAPVKGIAQKSLWGNWSFNPYSNAAGPNSSPQVGVTEVNAYDAPQGVVGGMVVDVSMEATPTGNCEINASATVTVTDDPHQPTARIATVVSKGIEVFVTNAKGDVQKWVPPDHPASWMHVAPSAGSTVSDQSSVTVPIGDAISAVLAVNLGGDGKTVPQPFGRVIQGPELGALCR